MNMKNKTFIILLSSILSFNLSAQLTFTHNGANYQIVQEFKTWEQAATAAVQQGGFLAQIEDQAEQTAIYNAIMNAGISTTYTAVGDGGGTAYIWIGATDKANESTWLWDGNNDNEGVNFFTGQGNLGDFSAPGYNNWGGKGAGSINEPDDFQSNQDAAAIALAKWPTNPNFTLGVAGEWNDININNQLYYIIEFPISSCKTDNLTINETPIAADTYETTGTINAMGTVSSTGEVIFKSAQNITLLPNFHAVQGASFSAIIADCSANTLLGDLPGNTLLQTIPNASIPAITNLNIIEVYPNPVIDYFQFELSTDKQGSLYLFDVAGRLQFSTMVQQGTNSVNVANLNDGLYFLKVQVGAEIWTGKMIKE